MSKEKKKETGKEKQEKHEWNQRAKEIWLAGLGALSAVEEEGSKMFRSLVERGTTYEKKRKEQMDELWNEVSERYEKAEDKFGESFDKAEERIERNLKSVISSMGIPSRKEIQELSNKVDALNRKIDQIKEKQSAGAAKSGGKKGK
jgi:poly(hydroxyalkanoate) granule-associated protein